MIDQTSDTWKEVLRLVKEEQDLAQARVNDPATSKKETNVNRGILIMCENLIRLPKISAPAIERR